MKRSRRQGGSFLFLVSKSSSLAGVLDGVSA